jgi:hypothetical protein
VVYVITTNSGRSDWLGYIGIVVLGHSLCGLTFVIALIFLVSRSHIFAVTRLAEVFVDKQVYYQLAPAILQHPVDAESFLELEHIVTDGMFTEHAFFPNSL